ncbi:HAAS signaling domain-containing protein [Oceanobacillus bengalensis]|uniref:DUF1700 domain-containing protein n=1 Tax=Oceanobacillus bengalensis TaxID=1435466 RepID=A0A494YU18_9BACI|nr:DUF1700 domain-containing protein [Oceanobacillus bengalensis]RKQ13621.1 DUF1700 domain-containing protein [Oceanobacillus bengalensis]
MIEPKQRFIQELDKAIGKHPQKVEILEEYEVHIYDLLQEFTEKDGSTYEQLISRLGSPEEIAKVWQEEKTITPRKTQWLFVIINTAIFAGGIFLTFIYNVFQWEWAEQLWEGLTDIPSIIIFVYILFWALLGYEIGKEFGERGYKLLKRTFWLSIVPNLLLMYLVIFKLIPHEWFQPLLSVPFIIVCIVFTGLLYPITWIGYRWGRKISI